MIAIFLSLLITANISLAAQRDDSKEINPEGCGFRLEDLENNYLGISKLTNAFNTTPGDWGWMGSLNYKSEHNCGIFLINSQWALTAAHCFFSPINIDEYTFNFGNHHRTDLEPWTLTRRISKLIIHENYVANRFGWDVALVKLDRPVVYSKYILPACLATVFEDYGGKLGHTIGWGRIGLGEPRSDYLLQLPQYALTNKQCTDKYPLMNPLLEICVGTEEDDAGACNTDSGGPFHIVNTNQNDSNRGKWVVVGIVEFAGLGCKDTAGYSRVSAYINWIKQRIENN